MQGLVGFRENTRMRGWRLESPSHFTCGAERAGDGGAGLVRSYRSPRTLHLSARGENTAV